MKDNEMPQKKTGGISFVVYKLHGEIVILVFDSLHNCLEVVYLLSRNTHLIFLNLCLYLELQTLDKFDDFFGLFHRNARLKGNHLADGATQRIFCLPKTQRLYWYVPLC